MKKALKQSEEFGEIAGTRLNKKKVKLLIHDKEVEEKLKKDVKQIGVLDLALIYLARYLQIAIMDFIATLAIVNLFYKFQINVSIKVPAEEQHFVILEIFLINMVFV